MIEWEEIIKAEDMDDLKKAKLWLFRENMRLENERTEFLQSRDKFLKERMQFRNEMDSLNRRTIMERKRLKEENLFFEKKMAILQDGFRKLEEDRRKLEREKRMAAEEIAKAQDVKSNFFASNIAEVLFRSVRNHPLALRKRYRDLMKIFHPDNMFGDEELVQQINKEFVKRKKEEQIL